MFLKKKWNKQYTYFMYGLMQKFSNTLQPMGGNFLKDILTFICCTEYSEINVSHTVIQKHVSY